MRYNKDQNTNLAHSTLLYNFIKNGERHSKFCLATNHSASNILVKNFNNTQILSNYNRQIFSQKSHKKI